MKVLTVPSSGSIAGQTNSRNRYGQYIRTRAIPVNPSTTVQASVRSQLALWSSTWRTLSNAARTAWESYAATHPRTDALGQSITITGAQAYIGYNIIANQYSQPTSENPPADPTFDGPQILTLTSAAGAITCTFTVPPDADHSIGLYFSPPRSAGVSFESDYRLLAVLTDANTSPLVLTTIYSTRFGLPTEGQRIFLRARQAVLAVLGPVQEMQVIFNA